MLVDSDIFLITNDNYKSQEEKTYGYKWVSNEGFFIDVNWKDDCLKISRSYMSPYIVYYVNGSFYCISNSIKILSQYLINDRGIKLTEKIYYERPETLRKKIVRFFVKSFIRFLYRVIYRVKKIGQKDISEDESYIICANHLNYLDATAVVVFNKKNIRFICKHTIFKHKFLNWILHLVDAIPINREKNDIEAMKRSIKALKNNELLGIFPEGTRKGMEKNVQVKNGAAFMALRSKVKVIPLGIQGSFKPFTKVYLNYGKPLDFSKYYGKEKDKEVLDIVTKEIMDNIVMLTNEKK